VLLPGTVEVELGNLSRRDTLSKLELDQLVDLWEAEFLDYSVRHHLNQLERDSMAQIGDLERMEDEMVKVLDEVDE